MREPLALITIVCDDRVTAPRYFGAMRQVVREHAHLKIVRAPSHGTSPDELFKCAKRQAGGTGRKDSVWLCLDFEGDREKRARIRTIWATARGSRVRVLVSAPCFELWTLYHLEDTGKRYNDCRGVLRRIAKLWRKRFGQKFEKSRADYGKIIGEFRVAAQRAQKHWDGATPAGTEIFRVIEEIERLITSDARS